ncbi:MAG: right-handed parallel beta-helix repeat-containing protein, partial [Pseudomonadota bacterium]
MKTHQTNKSEISNNSASGKIFGEHFRKHLLATTVMTVVGVLTATMAQAAPSLPTPSDSDSIELPNTNAYGKEWVAPTVTGSVTFVAPHTHMDGDKNNLDINQSSNRALIDWTTFNIGTKGIVKFNQHQNTDLAVNRVTNNTIKKTEIFGALQANGRVMILDKNGVLFGKTAKIDVGSIIASTGNIAGTNADFVNGTGTFDLNIDDNTKSVENQSDNFTVADGGLVAFVAPTVKNSGTITAKLGKVTLAAGKRVTVSLTASDELITIAIGSDGELSNALVQHSGAIIANGGRVTLSAREASTLLNTVINMSGTINADRFDATHPGKIVLSGGAGGKVLVSGDMTARNEPSSPSLGSPDIDVSGKNIEITGTGDLDASANGDHGNGGAVKVVATGDVNFKGEIDVSGGSHSGNGGLAEVSGSTINYTGTVDARAPHGAMGSLTLDPATFTIGTPGYTPSITAAVLAAQLNLSNVGIFAGSNIELVSDVDLHNWTVGSTLSLTAPTLDLIHKLTMGTSGDLALNATTINLNDRIVSQDHGHHEHTIDIRTSSHITSTASVVNVQSDNARVQQGIDLAGATVNVAMGEYKENLVVYKSLSLLGGAGDTLPILMGTTPDGAVVLVTAGNVTVDGFDIRGKILGDRCEDGEGDHHNILSAYGILVEGAGNFTASNNRISGIGIDGINVSGGEGAYLAGNYITGAGRDGLHAEDSNGLDIVGNTVEGSDEYGAGAVRDGIFVRNTEESHIDGNTITGNADGMGAGRDGIHLENGTDTTINDNVISFNAGDEISLLRYEGENDGDDGDDNGDDEAGNLLSVGRDGIHIEDSEEIGLFGNDVRFVKGDGIHVEDSEEVGLFGNDVRFVKGDGIHIEDSEEVGLFGNDVRFVKGDGIHVEDSEEVGLFGNDVRFVKGDGIHVEDSEEVGLFGNDARFVKGDGIHVEDSEEVRISGNDVYDIGDDGIHVKNSSYVNLLRNDVRLVGNDGIRVSDSIDVSIVGNRIADSGDDGIEASSVWSGENEDSHTLTISGNHIYGTGTGNGISVIDSYNPDISYNTITGAGNDGIHVENGGIVGITGNTVSGSGEFDLGAAADGIFVGNSLSSTITGNTVSDVGSDGIHVAAYGVPDPTFIEGNHIYGAGWNGIEVNGLD